MPLPTEVSIDIRPLFRTNFIRENSRFSVIVAIKTQAGFNALDVDPATAQFGPNGAPSRRLRINKLDIDRDGDKDLLLKFRIRDTGIACGDTEVSVTAQTFAGELIQGSDSVFVIGCR